MEQEKNRNKKKIIIVAIVFLLVLLIATYTVYCYYVKGPKPNVSKEELFASIANHDLKFFAENDLYVKIADKLANQPYVSDANITLSNTMENNMFSDLDLSKFEFSYHVTNNQPQSKKYVQFVTKYASNHLLTLDFIHNQTQFAAKSDEIVNRYVGLESKNLPNITSKLWNTQVDFVALKKLNHFMTQREMVDFSTISKSKEMTDYGEIFKKNVNAEQISKKENVVITFDSEQVKTTEYTISMAPNEANQLLQEISQKIENDQTTLPELVVTNIQNFEEDSEILEYHDNDSEPREQTTQTPAEQSNFESSLPIWSINSTTENTTITPENTVNTVPVQNTTNSTAQNTVTENTTNSVENTVVEENRQETPPAEEMPTDTNQETPTENEITQPEAQPEQTTNETVPLEDENLRPQGFIQVNENTENAENDEETQDFVVGENWEETLQNIVKLSNQIDWKTYLLTGAKANFSQDELVASLQEMLTKEIKENHSLVIKAYTSEDKLVKLNFQVPEVPKSLDVEIVSRNDQEKYLNLTLLKGQTSEANGYKISLYKKVADANVKNTMDIHKVSKSKIIQKTSLNMEIRGTVHSKKYTADMSFQHSDNAGEIKVNADATLNFDASVDVEDLNGENCLLLDTLSEEELALVNQQIKEKTVQVLREKNKNLNFIDTNHSNLIVQQTGTQENPAQNEEAKNVARQALIDTVKNKMREFLDAGSQLKLQDLEGLEIPDYAVEVSISENLALITVNGFRFTIDADFNLSDS